VRVIRQSKTRRLPHRDSGYDQQWQDDEADGALELGLEGRVQVADQHERCGQVDDAGLCVVGRRSSLLLAHDLKSNA
jgi:hypothetical protein